MAIKQYEGMFLLNSNKYAQDPAGAVGEVLALLERMKAEVIAHRPWQDGKLAYPIEGQTKGVHYLIYFKAEAAELTDFYRRCKLNEGILRYMVIEPPARLFDLMAQSLVEPAAVEAAEPADAGSADNASADNAEATKETAGEETTKEVGA